MLSIKKLESWGFSVVKAVKVPIESRVSMGYMYISEMLSRPLCCRWTKQDQDHKFQSQQRCHFYTKTL